jgi:hypothetical protein
MIVAAKKSMTLTYYWRYNQNPFLILLLPTITGVYNLNTIPTATDAQGVGPITATTTSPLSYPYRIYRNLEVY